MKDYDGIYYDEIFEARFRAATNELRVLSKIYWIKAHRVALASGKKEVSNFTANILARIAMVEAEESAA